MQRYISFSGGVESTAMCVLYGKGATAIWCDTGAEHKEMYRRIDFVEKQLKKLHGDDFEIIRIKPSVTCKGKKVSSLTECIKRKAFFPTKQHRFCTSDFKIIPIDFFLSEQAQPHIKHIKQKYADLEQLARNKKKSIIRRLKKRRDSEYERIKCNELMIGFNAEEEPGSSRVGSFMKNLNTVYTYPLYQDGYSREDCEDILNLHGLHPNMPIYMQRGGCKYCPFKTVKEYKALYFLDRETFEENKELEEALQDKRGKYFSISMSQKSFQEIERICKEEIQMLGENQIKESYKKIKPSQACGAFCHR